MWDGSNPGQPVLWVDRIFEHGCQADCLAVWAQERNTGKYDVRARSQPDPMRLQLNQLHALTILWRTLAWLSKRSGSKSTGGYDHTLGRTTRLCAANRRAQNLGRGNLTRSATWSRASASKRRLCYCRRTPQWWHSMGRHQTSHRNNRTL